MKPQGDNDGAAFHARMMEMWLLYCCCYCIVVIVVINCCYCYCYCCVIVTALLLLLLLMLLHCLTTNIYYKVHFDWPGEKVYGLTTFHGHKGD